MTMPAPPLRAIGADALVYQDIAAMRQSVTDVAPHLTRFDASCFDGVYVTGDVTAEYLDRVEAARQATGEAGYRSDHTNRNQLNLQPSEAD